MSRVGSKPITVPGGVEIHVDGNAISVKGPKGALNWEVPEGITLDVSDGGVTVGREGETKTVRALHGTSRSLIANMVEGVHTGYTRQLDIHGVGFRAQMQGATLVMNVGYSHEIRYNGIEGVEMTTPNDTTIVVNGPDKQAVGQVAARIRAFCPAEPYKGKGIKYKDEHIRRKAGKTVA